MSAGLSRVADWDRHYSLHRRHRLCWNLRPTRNDFRTLEARSGATADELERFKRQAYEVGSPQARIRRRAGAGQAGFRRLSHVAGRDRPHGVYRRHCHRKSQTDKALRTLEARSGATADQMERFKRQAYEVGSQLPLNTADIIRAQTAFKQLGNSIDEVFAATPGIARFAVGAEGVGIEDSARYASVALRAFGLDAEDTQLVLDQMLLAETKTAAAARDIGEAFRFSAQSAADAGLGTQSYIAILGTLAGSGRSAEESSQGLNVLLTKLSKGMSGVGRGGKMVKDVLAEVGLTGADVERELAKGEAGIFDFLELIKKATEGNAALRTSVLAALVGESYASSFSFLIANIEDARATFLELGDASGESARQAAIQMKGLSGSWESFKAQVDTVRNVLSDTGVGIWVERLLRTAAGLMAELTRVGDSGEYVHGRLLKIISAASLAGPALLALGAALKGLSFALGGLAPIAAAITWIGNVTGIATAAQWAWNAAVAAGSRLSAVFGAAMLRMQGIGVAAATALNIAWSRLYLTLKFGGIKGLFLSLWAAISAARRRCVHGGQGGGPVGIRRGQGCCHIHVRGHQGPDAGGPMGRD